MTTPDSAALVRTDSMRTPLPPEDALVALFAYCQAHDWAGYDPYDALNSRLLRFVPGGKLRLPQLAITQLFKRSPVNLRPMFLVPRTQNPKALALMLRAALKVEGLGFAGTSGLITYFIDRIVALRSANHAYWCWGYSFPWQTRTLCVPRDAPNLVCTTFVAEAILDAWQTTRESRLLEIAASAANYIARELYFEDDTGIASFSYPSPGLRSTIHNANLLAAALLIRVQGLIPDAQMLQRGLAAARFSASRQRQEGSWPYGEEPKQGWVDNFHTGYNLTALRSIGRILGTKEFDVVVRKGFEFYAAHFVRDDGAPRYFHDRTYPIDIHCVAQTILTMLEFAELDSSGPGRAQHVYDWAVANMRDSRGYFYYRVLRFLTIRTPYMRWSQAWMLLALAALVVHRRQAPTYRG
jgi:hypothetical protein